MPKVALLGNSLPPVSAIALGTADWGTRTGDDLDRVYATFREAGGNCFDSAHCYAFWLDAEGASERTLGQQVRKHDQRKDVVIATKGCHCSGGPKYHRPDQYMTAQWLASDLRDSLDRLQMDFVDIYFLHRDDPRVPVNEILDALEEQQRAGRIRRYAASNWWPGRLEQAADYCRRKGYSGFAASQVLYNLAQLANPLGPDMCAADATIEAWHAKSKLPLFAFSSTANGYFAKPTSAGGGYATPLSELRHQRATELAAKHGATANQIALAYLMNQAFPVVPIVGSMRVVHIEDAAAASHIRLSPTELAYLRAG